MGVANAERYASFNAGADNKGAGTFDRTRELLPSSCEMRNNACNDNSVNIRKVAFTQLKKFVHFNLKFISSARDIARDTPRSYEVIIIKKSYDCLAVSNIDCEQHLIPVSCAPVVSSLQCVNKRSLFIGFALCIRICIPIVPRSYLSHAPI